MRSGLPRQRIGRPALCLPKLILRSWCVRPRPQHQSACHHYARRTLPACAHLTLLLLRCVVCARPTEHLASSIFSTCRPRMFEVAIDSQIGSKADNQNGAIDSVVSKPVEFIHNNLRKPVVARSNRPPLSSFRRPPTSHAAVTRRCPDGRRRCCRSNAAVSHASATADHWFSCQSEVGRKDRGHPHGPVRTAPSARPSAQLSAQPSALPSARPSSTCRVQCAFSIHASAYRVQQGTAGYSRVQDNLKNLRNACVNTLKMLIFILVAAHNDLIMRPSNMRGGSL